jgi:phenylpropionate dioxygenase-like ring-hydroxylating dioxygenase large terminal subunit
VTASAPRREEREGVAVVTWTDERGCARAAADRCPHRRAPLSAGTVDGGVLRCAYHGWSFAGDGRCIDIPALGAGAHIPTRARLEILDEGRAPHPAPEPEGPWLDGDTPGLEHFWHALARIGDLPRSGTATFELLGGTWDVRSTDDPQPVVVDEHGAPPAAVALHLDHLWIAPRPPRSALPGVPEWGAAGWHHRRLSRAEGRFGVGLLLDNQLDAGHFAFVHAGTFGRPETAALLPAEVETQGMTATATLRVPIAARNDPDAGTLDGHPVEQHRTMHYEFHAPLWLRLQLDYEELGGSTIILFAFVPLGRGRARMDVDMLFRHPDGFTDTELDERMVFEETVVGEDLTLQRLFDDLRLPLEPTVEMHTRADRYSLVCRDLIRRALDEVTAGT